MSEPYHPPLSPFVTGLRCRCPRCGRGKVFEGFLTVRAHCAECGLDLGPHDTGDGPAVFIIFILGAVVVPLALWFETAVEPPLWVHAVLWGVVIMGATLGLIRPLKGVLISLQFVHQTPTQ